MPGHRSGQYRNDAVVRLDTDVYTLMTGPASPAAGGNDVKMETN